MGLMIISKNSNRSCQNIYSSENFLQLLCIMHISWHYKLQSKARLFIMVFICTNSCAKYNLYWAFLYQSCNISQAFEHVKINRHDYVAFDTFDITINSGYLQVNLVSQWSKLRSLLDSNIGSLNGFNVDSS